MLKLKRLQVSWTFSMVVILWLFMIRKVTLSCGAMCINWYHKNQCFVAALHFLHHCFMDGLQFLMITVTGDESCVWGLNNSNGSKGYAEYFQLWLSYVWRFKLQGRTPNDNSYCETSKNLWNGINDQRME